LAPGSEPAEVKTSGVFYLENFWIKRFPERAVATLLTIPPCPHQIAPLSVWLPTSTGTRKIPLRKFPTPTNVIDARKIFIWMAVAHPKRSDFGELGGSGLSIGTWRSANLSSGDQTRSAAPEHPLVLTPQVLFMVSSLVLIAPIEKRSDSDNRHINCDSLL
jgi:hypothetical protein